MLSAHAWLIAAFFVPYVLFMVSLGFYIWHTGRPPRQQEDDGEQDDGLGDLPLAA